MSAPDASASARFEAIFEAYHRRVLAYALRRSRSEADAEDAVADTFAVAWRRIGDVPDDALPWLLGVARRVAANQHRSAGRFAGLIARLRAQPSEASVVASDSPAAMALDRLPLADQELLRLLAWDGLTQAEAGVVLGISANAVAIRLHRARKRFTDELLKGSELSRTLVGVEGRTPREQTP
ncbi:MAG: sigma-70 family RNA polymerase sigma factor [Chloroflexi bacterium]|nr:sigma-70 family RNA polymerase sigma factor [Chloroflexota bacterium]